MLIEHKGKLEFAVQETQVAHLKFRISTTRAAAPTIVTGAHDVVPRGLELLLLAPVAAKAREAVALEASIDIRKLVAEMALWIAYDSERNVRREDLLAVIPTMSL